MGVLTENFTKLKHLYLYEYWNTVRLSKEYNVSSSSVSEYLRRRNITSDHRDHLLFNKLCELNNQLKTHNLDILVNKLKKIYPNITKKKIKYICEKNNRHKLKTEFDFIDKEKIKNMLNEGLSATKIANKEQILYNHVCKIAKFYNIELQLIKRFKQQYNKEYTISEYNAAGTTQLSRKTNYSKDVVIAVLSDYGVSFGIPDEIKQLLLDKEWCVSQYNNTPSYKDISEKLKVVGPDTVAYYFKTYHGIKKAELIDDFPKLTDKNYVLSKYKNNSIYSASREIGCTPWLLKEWLIKHDIPIINSAQTSSGEKELLSFIKTILPDTKIIENDRTLIGPKEVDILIPEHKLAIEYCGVYYHSSKFKEESYHQNKYNLVKDKGFRLLTIYETEWLSKKDIVKNKIKHITQTSDCEKVYARKCNIKHVNESDARIFLNNNHIQGFTKCSLRVGLYYDDLLVSILCFVNKKDAMDLVRYATSCIVVGGFSKLLAHSKKYINDKEIITFADLRWSQEENNLYTTNRFFFDKKLKPAYMYVDRHGLHRREKYMKCKLKDLLNDYSEELTEKQNTENNNIYRIYDCGKIKYKLQATVI